MTSNSLVQVLLCSRMFHAFQAPSAMFARTSRWARQCPPSMVRTAPPSSLQPTVHSLSIRHPPGTIFDVVSTDNPINIAYSNIALDLHQDLPYYESPPGVQLLHCLKFSPSVTGAPPIVQRARRTQTPTTQLVITG
jgi:hypothetical protein